MLHKKKRKHILYAIINFTELFNFPTQDIPKPLFMSTKEPNDWSEDEQKLAKEYEKKVKDLQEEREKYRKVGISVKWLLFMQEDLGLWLFINKCIGDFKFLTIAKNLS